MTENFVTNEIGLPHEKYQIIISNMDDKIILNIGLNMKNEMVLKISGHVHIFIYISSLARIALLFRKKLNSSLYIMMKRYTQKTCTLQKYKSEDIFSQPMNIIECYVCPSITRW
jgi:hypothetical protein